MTTDSLDQAVEHFDPVAPETVKHFWPVVSHIRETCPVAHSDAHGGFWSLTRYADVQQASQDWQTFSSAQGTVFPRSAAMNLMPPIESDPPAHREWRRILNPLFTPAKVAEMEPTMRQVTTELIDEFIEDGVVDISKNFAQVLPGSIFFRVAFGIGADELRQVHEWVYFILQEIGPKTPEAHANLVTWLERQLVTRRENGPRRNDVLDALLDARLNGETYPMDELVTVLMMVTFGGLDTIQNATGNITLRLCQDPALADWLREDPTRIPRSIHEFLRIDPPAVLQTRVTTRDVEIGGRVIPAGERVALHYGAANRDPRAFDHPDELDFQRSHTKNLSFGMGVHRCLGSHYAEQELAIVIEQLVTRLRNLRLADTGVEIPYSFPRGRGPRSLVVLFDPGPRLGR